VLPGIGLIDDAAVMTTCLAALRADIERYRAWRSARVTHCDAHAG